MSVPLSEVVRLLFERLRSLSIDDQDDFADLIFALSESPDDEEFESLIATSIEILSE